MRGYSSTGRDSIRNCEKEIGRFQATKIRPENLEKLYNDWFTIKSTSVKPERAFSAMGAFATKLKERLNDESLSVRYDFHAPVL